MQVVVTILQGFVYRLQWAFFYHTRLSPNHIQTLLDKNVLSMLIISALISLFIYWWLFKGKSKNLWAYCHFSRARMPIIGLALLLGISFNLTFMMFDFLTSFDRLFPDYSQVVEPLMSGGFVLTLIVVGIAVPAFEEILFRGILFNGLKTYLPLTTALLVQGFLFGAYHLNLLQGIYGMILGILAALVYEWFHSIWVPIAVHVAFNSFSIMMSRISTIQVIFQYGAITLTGSGLILGWVIYRLWKSYRMVASEVRADFAGTD